MSAPDHPPRPAMFAALSVDGPALLSVSAAARLIGCSRSTVLRRIEAGELTRTPDGELHRGDVMRVLGELIDPCPDVSVDMVADTPADRAGQGRAVAAEPAKGDALAAAEHVAWLRELVDEQRRTIERKDRELREAAEQAERRESTWLRQLDSLTTKLLPAPAEPEPPAPTRGVFRRLFG